MRISDWSSDVCSSDLKLQGGRSPACGRLLPRRRLGQRRAWQLWLCGTRAGAAGFRHRHPRLPAGAEGALARLSGGDRKSVVEGKSVSVRVDLGGRRTIKKKKRQKNNTSPHQQ